MRAFHEIRKYGSEKLIPINISRIQNLSFRAHWHQDVEMLYVECGEIRVGINQNAFLLKSGDFAIIGSDDIHYYESTGQESTVKHFFMLAKVNITNLLTKIYSINSKD